MSLYSDNPGDQEPFQLLTAALSAPAESKDQVDALLVVSGLLEQRPAAVAEICLPLFEAIKSTGDTALKRWVMDRIAFGVGRSSLEVEAKTSIAETVLVDMVQMLQDASSAIVKLAVQCLCSIYPLLFRQLCLSRPPSEQQWQLLTAAKTQILSFALAISIEPATLGQPKHVNVGVRSVAWKFIQRALMVATRGGSADPRIQLRNKGDPNLNLVPAEHPFIKTMDLMNETNQLIGQITQTLATSDDPKILHPLLNMLPPLLKARPALATSLIPSLASWTPANLISSNRPAAQIRGVEKEMKIVMVHLLRTGIFPAFVAQLNDSLTRQNARTSAAVKVERVARQEAAARRAQNQVKREHEQGVRDLAEHDQGHLAKRQKIESNSTMVPRQAAPSGALPPRQLGPDIDVTTLGFDLMLEYLFASLNQLDDSTIRYTLEQTRQQINGKTEPHYIALAQSLGPSASVSSGQGAASSSSHHPAASIDPSTAALPSRLQEDEPDDMLLDPLDEESAIPSAAEVDGQPAANVKLEDRPAENPLNMVVEEDEVEDETAPVTIPDEEVSTAVPVQQEEVLPSHFIDFTIPPVEPLSEADREHVILEIIKRICQTGTDVQRQVADQSDTMMLDEDSETITRGLTGDMISPKEMWVVLLARMASRSSSDGVAANDAEDVKTKSEESSMTDGDWVRKALCEYIIEDFSSRSKLARVWLNEEWYSEQISPIKPASSSYEKWLRLLLSKYLEKIENGNHSDTFLSSFLIDLPDVPREVLEILRGLCEQTESAPVGLSTLREIITFRPPLRQSAMGLLLDMTTHPDRKIRLTAINTAKKWVPDTSIMSEAVLSFAQSTFQKLAQTTGDDIKMSNASSVHYTYLPETLPLPVTQELVQQYVELMFALSVRETHLLEDIFKTFPQCEATVQEQLKTISVPLIRSLGAGHAKLLECLRTFPPESEAFALHVVSVLTDNVRPSQKLVAAIKHVANERDDLNPAFLLPIAAQLNRTELYKFLPRIVSILSDNPIEKRKTIQTVFRNIIPLSDINTSTNLPKSKPEELSAADLLVLLHEQEKQIGVPAAKEAIDICFTLTDRFPSEVLAVVMQRIIDSVSLPILFMRTVIRSVQTYKSLVGYVSTTLLSRLITKKIWTSPQLWLGFMHCVKAIAPASFGALMQLPREQLKELIEKQPAIKPSLYQYVVQKAGVAKAQSLADLFGTPVQSPAAQQPIPSH